MTSAYVPSVAHTAETIKNTKTTNIPSFFTMFSPLFTKVTLPLHVYGKYMLLFPEKKQKKEDL